MALISDDLSVNLVQLAADYVKKPFAEVDKEQRTIAVKNASIFGQILPIVEAFVRAPNENSSVSTLSDNLHHLSLSKNSVEKCVAILRSAKLEVHSDQALLQRHFDTVREMKWRVDITISSSALSRVLEPNIIMELRLDNGRRITFELSVSKFHKLRYTVASILKEMDLMNSKMSAIKV
ncbi:COMM domain-containing protein 5-like [Frankliniella occidentalis]|uniref:COMM domain-containing protein 5 n=1 Tax=Frankliniella occidentalis TaxID=133901 RepID=A0A6J1TRP9_FRAOC|nr:COMM domain-containing protein 5-like [Frankliniella occidentalis]